MQYVFPTRLESSRAIGHHALTLGGADLLAEIGLSRLAELALAAFRSAAYG